MQSFKYEKLNVIDDKLVQHEPVVKMYRGSEQSSKMVSRPVGGSVNQSQVQFNISTTASNYFDRKPMIKTTFTVPVLVSNKSVADIVVAQNTAFTAPGLDVTMSAYPASNLFGMCSVDINGYNVGSYDMGKYAPMLLKLSNVSKNMNKTTCPSCPENTFANLNDANYTLSNPQSNYNDSTQQYIGNGCWTFKNPDPFVSNLAGKTLTANATNSAIVTYVIESYEPLILPPFVWNPESDDSEAIFGMNSLLITLNVNQATAYRALRTLTLTGSNTSLTMSVVPGGVILTDCELHYKTYRAPSVIDFKLPSPLSSLHTYNFYNNFVNATGTFIVPQGGSVGTSTINMSNVVSSGMPSLIIIWCDKSTYTSAQAKYVYPITNLSIDLGTNQSMLVNYTQTDLFNLSEQSGLNQSYLSFIGQAYAIGYTALGVVTPAASPKQLVGGPIVLTPGISFPLPAEVSTNSSGSFTWGFHATCSSSNTIDISGCNSATAIAEGRGTAAINAVTPSLNIMMIYDTWVSIDTSTLQCSINKAMLTVPEVLGMSRTEAVTIDDIKSESGGALQSHDVVKSGGGFKASGKLASRVKR